MKSIKEDDVYICRTQEDWNTLEKLVMSSGGTWFKIHKFHKEICVRVCGSMVRQSSEKWYIEKGCTILEVPKINDYEIY